MYADYLVLSLLFSFFFFKQKTAYEMRISDWSSDVCSSDLYWLRPWDGLSSVAACLPCGRARPTCPCQSAPGPKNRRRGRSERCDPHRPESSRTSSSHPCGSSLRPASDRKSTRLNSSH